MPVHVSLVIDATQMPRINITDNDHADGSRAVLNWDDHLVLFQSDRAPVTAGYELAAYLRSLADAVEHVARTRYEKDLAQLVLEVDQ